MILAVLFLRANLGAGASASVPLWLLFYFGFYSTLASPSRFLFSICSIFYLLILPCYGLELMMSVVLLVFLFSLVCCLYNLGPLGIFEY